MFGGTVAPPAGLCDDTTPWPYWLEQALLWDPTLRPAPLRVAPADAGDCPSTLGTDTDVCVPDTVSCHRNVRLDLGASRPGSGSITVPTGWVLVTYLTL